MLPGLTDLEWADLRMGILIRTLLWTYSVLGRLSKVMWESCWKLESTIQRKDNSVPEAMPSGKQKPRSQGWGSSGEWSQRRGVALLRKVELLELDHPIPAQTDSQEEVPQPCHTSLLDCCSSGRAASYWPRRPRRASRGAMWGCGWGWEGVRVSCPAWASPTPQEAISSHQACPSWEAVGGWGAALTLIRNGIPFSEVI